MGAAGGLLESVVLDGGLSGWGELVPGEGGRQSLSTGVEVGCAGALGGAG